MATDHDAIIIGAGPAGSSAAILLACDGWKIALVEKQDFPRRKVCGECIAASNLPLLEALGIGRTFFELAGPPLRQLAVAVGDRLVRADFPPCAHDGHQWGVALGREYLDTLLLEQAARCGAEVFRPWIVRRIERRGGQFGCHIVRAHSGESLRLTAPLLIDAHGSWEAGPDTGPERPLPRSSDLLAFKANFSDTSLEGGTLPVLSFPGGYGGMVIGSGGIATFACCMRRDTLLRCRRAMPEWRAADVAAAHVMRSCRYAREMLDGARRQGRWLSAGPLRPGIRLRSGCGDAFMIGNAAGEAHPIIGEGISMAIQSAWLLAERLAPYKSGIRDPQLQAALRENYLRAWRRHFAPRIRLAALFAHIAMRPAPADAAAFLLARYPGLLAQAARWSGKVRPVPLREPPAGWQPATNRAPSGANQARSA